MARKATPTSAARGDFAPTRQTITVRRVLALGMVAVLAGVLIAAGCSSSSSQTTPASSTPAASGSQTTPASSTPAASSSQAASVPADDSLDARVEAKLASMTLEEKVAQMFFVFPESIVSGVSTVVQTGDVTKAGLTRYPVGGIILSGPNLESPSQTKTMLANYQTYSHEISGLPLFLGVDEEGGTVSRVASNPAFGHSDVGDMGDVGATGDPERARAVGVQLGEELTGLGFNVDFAPDADVFDSSLSSIMEDRSFGSDPELVSQMVTAEIEGMRSAGLLSCAKHFPGHGAAEGDSHTDMVVTTKTLDELGATDFQPFRAAIAAQVPFVMVGHISCPAVTGDNTPASLSNQMVDGVLRGQLGYGGIIITDSMNMGAITENHDSAEAAILAIEAGEDMMLGSPDFATAYQGVIDAVHDGTISEDRIDQSVRRILAVKLAG